MKRHKVSVRELNIEDLISVSGQWSDMIIAVSCLLPLVIIRAKAQ